VLSMISAMMAAVRAAPGVTAVALLRHFRHNSRSLWPEGNAPSLRSGCFADVSESAACLWIRGIQHLPHFFERPFDLHLHCCNGGAEFLSNLFVPIAVFTQLHDRASFVGEGV